MTIEEIFRDRRAFKEQIINNVQEELDKFGLWVVNANIRELQDSQGSEYFKYMRQKKRSEAESSARVAVSEATKLGDLGEKEREKDTRTKVSEYERDSRLVENTMERQVQLSNAELEVRIA